MTGRKIAIVGSRSGVDKQAVDAFVDLLDESMVVVSGGAKGVDSWAASRARERGMEVVVFQPKWEKYGKSAGFRRNKEIVMAADDVAAFWDGSSHGTEHTMRLAVKMAKPLALFDSHGVLIGWFSAERPPPERMEVVRGYSPKRS